MVFPCGNFCSSIVLSLISVPRILLVMVRCYSTKGIKNRFSDKDLRNAPTDLKEKKGSIRKITSTVPMEFHT